MQVIAKAAGYHGRYRNPGDKFEVPEGTKGSWFTPVGNKKEGSLDTLSAPALKELLDAKGINYAGNASKAVLISLLENPPHPDDEEDFLA
jgi:hypothetical protein